MQIIVQRTNRFTPTRVGKTKAQAGGAWAAAVHPHACGENVRYADVIMYVTGSPPRVWGKLAPTRAPGNRARFTPTRVGKTASLPSQRTLPTVHPHACGENGA